MRLFQPGEPVVRREILRGEPWIAWPHICVSDDGSQLVTYLPPGATWQFPATGRFPAGQHPYLATGKISWQGHGMLAIHWEDVDHSLHVFWSGPERRFSGWYFNLQDAPRRTEIGFDTLDHELDLVWPADSPSWQWKDVDEFARTGPTRYPGRVAEIQAEGDRLAKLLDADERWWDESWADWQPDPQWTTPSVPPGWTEVPFTTR